MPTAILNAFLGTFFTFLMTVLGAAIVLFFGNIITENTQKLFFGFASGVMIAASVWSLIIPAVEMIVQSGGTAWITASLGIVSGILFLILCDGFLNRMLHKNFDGHLSKKGMLMTVFAVTLHNIPEGIAVAVAFVLAATERSDALLLSAISLAIGIGIQNVPEGAAISLPLRTAGYSKKTSFLFGGLSGIVEPIFGVLAALTFGFALKLLPFMLCFAAGAMIYVATDELIPKSKGEEDSKIGTLGVMIGFIIMMILDITL